MEYTAAVITVSDRCSKGERPDASGPKIKEVLSANGWNVIYAVTVPDEHDAIRDELLRCSDRLGVQLCVTTGGTGFSPRDITPEVTLEVCEKEIRGIPEAMRAHSMKITPRGCLSRAAAGIRKLTMIINLPGSAKAASENLEAVIEPLSHGAKMLLHVGSADCASDPETQKDRLV